MFFTLLKLRLTKALRSVSLSRNLVKSVFKIIVGLIVLFNVLIAGFTLPAIIEDLLDKQQVITFLNQGLIFFFLAEICYRFFFQGLSTIALENYLHLPIRRSGLIHFMLLNSFITPLNIIAALLFAPIAFTKVSSVYGSSGAIYWMLTVLGISWAIHWFMGWFKLKYGDRLSAMLILLGIYAAGVSSMYYGWFNIGLWTAPFFDAAIHTIVPFLLVIGCGILLYSILFNYYQRNAYLEKLKAKNEGQYFNFSFSFFNQFGRAGIIAEQELKLILRHKRPRGILGVSTLFLLYGFMYKDVPLDGGIPLATIIVGILTTGFFIINYGQYFLSWNSAFLDFYSSKSEGLKALISGKYLLLSMISFIYFLLTTPFAYFGWEIFFIQLTTFLFNIGIVTYFIIYIALWKPKPIDISKGAMFNYEGIGISNFLAPIPIITLPFLVFLLFSWLINDFTGLFVLGVTGLLGIIFNKKILQLLANRLCNNKYQIGTTFRQEI